MIVIVTSSMASPGAREFERAAISRGDDVMVCLVDHPTTPDAIDRADVVIIRIGPLSFTKYEALLSQITEPQKYRLLSNTLVAFDKCRSYEIMRTASVPVPDSIIITKPGVPPFLPGVFKIPRGNQGRGVALIRDQAAYADFVAEYLNEEALLYQRYVPESKGNDKRIIVYEQQFVAAMQRAAAADDFRANIHLGGSAASYSPTAEEIKLAVDAVAAHGLPYAGVDIIDSNDGPLVLEVNPSPGLQISQITGVDVAAELLNYSIERRKS